MTQLDRKDDTEKQRKQKLASWLACLLGVARYEVLSGFKRKKFLGIFVLSIIVSSIQWIPGMPQQLPKPPYPFALISLRYDFLFGGTIGFLAFALIVAIDSISGEFEQETIVMLLTKPVTKAIVFFGKFLGAILVLLAALTINLLANIFWSFFFYGPQNGMILLPFDLAGLMFNAIIFLSIVFAFAWLTKSTIMTMILSLGYYVIEASIETLKQIPLADFLPGYGVGLRNPSVASGTTGLGPLMEFYLQNGNTNLPHISLGLVPVTFLITQATIVGLVWIAVFLPLGLFAFRRSEIR